MKINNLSRKELYGLVWSKPLSTISIEFDISFLDLRKICSDYQIPVPKNGHWSKLKYSKPVKIIPFIDDFEGSNMIQYVPKIKSTKELVKKFKPIRTEVPLKLTNPLPEILEAQAKLKDFDFSRWSNMTYSSEVLSISVSNLKLLNRALRIMDVFLKSIVKRGFRYEIIRGSLIIEKYDIKENISCRELNNRKFFKDKHGWNSSSLSPNGLLSINILGYRGKRISTHTWRKTFGREVWKRNGQTEACLVRLSSLFNHSSIAITRLYLSITKEEVDNLYQLQDLFVY
jgi:hypothetical protein